MTTIDPAISIADRHSTTALSRHFIDSDLQPRSVVEAFPLTAFAVRDDGLLLAGSSRIGKLLELVSGRCCSSLMGKRRLNAQHWSFPST